MGWYNAHTNKFDKAVTKNLTDSENDSLHLYTSFDGYREKQNVMALNIPVIAQFEKDLFYLMSGFKVSIPIDKKYESKSETLTNKAHYYEINNWLTEEKFAGYGPFSGKKFNGDFDLGISVLLSLEAGLNWRQLTKDLSVYTGVYFDYGLINFTKQVDKQFINYDSKNPTEFTANSVLSAYNQGKINIMAAGIRIRLALKLDM
jgi:hypothetical protein